MVLKVVAEEPTKMPLAEDDYLVDALSTDVPDDRLDVGSSCQGLRGTVNSSSMPRRSSRARKAVLYTASQSRSRYLGGVSHGTPRRSARRFTRRRVLRDVEMKDPAPLVYEHDEDEQTLNITVGTTKKSTEGKSFT